MINRRPWRLAVLIIILGLSVIAPAPLTAAAPAEVLSTFPRSGEGDVNIDVLVTVNFDEGALPGAVIDENTFLLSDALGGPVPATVKYEAVSAVVTLSPHAPLAYGSEYTAVLKGPGLDREWNFKTIAASNHPPGRPRRLWVFADERGNRLNWKRPARADTGGDFKPPVRGGYIVYRAEAPGGEYVRVNKAPLTRTGFTDTEYGRPGVYFYTVRAIDAGGAAGPATAPRSNRKINASFVFVPGDRRPVSTANGAITLEPAETTKTLNVTVRSRAITGAPPSPLGPVELTASPPAGLKRLIFSVPGDPQGALILRATGPGWQPLTAERHSYDPEGRRVAYGPVRARGLYVVTNPMDRTPPTEPGPIGVRWEEGRPVVKWGRASDPDSGIRGYRLFSKDTDSSATTVVNLSPSTTTFTDARPGAGLRHYAVAAVNGGGELSPASTATLEWDSRPTVEKRYAFCGLCHDGTGSRVQVGGEVGAAGASGLCLTCHSTDRPSKTLTWRSRSDKTVAGLIKDGWKRSAHRRVAECRTCHKPSGSADSDPATDTLCFQCHGSDKPDSVVRGRADAPRCVHCHDIHESDGAVRSPGGGNLVQGPLKGASGVAPLNGGPGSVPSFLEMDRAVYEYQICLKCHSSFNKPKAGVLTDLAVLFNSANPSYHPVEAAIKAGAAPESLADGWKPGATMYCSDCHLVHPGSASRRGPEGADHKPVLTVPFGESAPPGRRNDLCFRCHVRKVYEEGKPGSRFSGAGGHQGHVGEDGIACAVCHEVHGSGFAKHLIRITPAEASGTVSFTHNPGGGGCKSSCHERPQEYRYGHAY